MTEVEIESFPYTPDTTRLFEAIADQPWAVFLDSGYPGCRHGRFDILSTTPVKTLITRGLSTEVREGEDVRYSQEDPFLLLQETLGPLQRGVPELPFPGGAIGYFSYDLSRRLMRLPALSRDEEDIPEMMAKLKTLADLK